MGTEKIWRSAAIGGILCGILYCIGVSDAFASATQRVSNQEFKFSVSFPAGNVVCTATSGDQPHGFFVRLDASQIDCKNLKKDTAISVISVYAYNNTTFESTPEEELVGLCRERDANGKLSEGRVLKGLTFKGRHSAACRTIRADGSIDIYVVTQAGKWPSSHDSPDMDAPYINYTASLHTTPSRMDRDIKTFHKILKSVQIEYSK